MRSSNTGLDPRGARRRRAGLRPAVLLGLAFALSAPASALAAPANQLKRIATTDGGYEAIGVARTPDGALHVVTHTRAGSGGSYSHGINAVSVSPSGHLGAQVAALSGWGDPDQPGLVVLPNGSLEAVIGGGGPDTGIYSGPFGIVSSDGGSTWSAPIDIGSHSMDAFAGPITARMSGVTPVMALPQAGNLIVQQGFGAGSPTSLLDTPTSQDGYVGDVDSAVDASTGDVVVSWQSLATPGGDWLQGVAPSTGSAQEVPGQDRTFAAVAGRDQGPGVFAAYTPDNVHVRLVRYGAGSVAVGALHGLTAKVVGVATGIDGRVWVMWGDDSKREVAITRSNKAATRFEPIQHLNSDAFDLWRIFGDGRLGPLDLLVNESPNVPTGQQLSNGIFYARVLPELSADISVSAVSKAAGKFKLSVKVTDAGDAVSGATAAAKGQHKKTGGNGVAKLTVKGQAGSHVTVKITAPGYRTLRKTVKL